MIDDNDEVFASNIRPFNLSYYDLYMERLWAVKTINGKKAIINLFLVYQFLNDAIYDWCDYIRDPDLKL